MDEPQAGVSVELEWVQLGIDALNEMAPETRAFFPYTEWYLHARKAVLEQHIPRGSNVYQC